MVDMLAPQMSQPGDHVLSQEPGVAIGQFGWHVSESEHADQMPDPQSLDQILDLFGHRLR